MFKKIERSSPSSHMCRGSDNDEKVNGKSIKFLHFAKIRDMKGRSEANNWQLTERLLIESRTYVATPER
jgi:hypothetical protein